MLVDGYVSLVGGTLTLTVPDSVTEIDPEVTEGYFLVLTATAGASAHSPNQIRITMYTDRLAAEDRSHDLPMTCEPADDLTTRLITIGSGIFADDFESEDTSVWSSTG